MTTRFNLGKAALTTAALAMTFTTVLAAPQLAAAQPYDGQQQGQYYDPCQADQNNRAVTGGVLGAVTGALIGNGVARGGGRTGGTIIGGIAGAAVGAKIGQSTSGCVNGPPPQQGYPAPAYYAPPPPPPPPPPPQCGRAMNRIFYPDGSTESYPVRACMAPDGHWHVARQD